MIKPFAAILDQLDATLALLPTEEIQPMRATLAALVLSGPPRDRVVKVKVGDLWEIRPFMSIRKGDVYRLFEADGIEVGSPRIAVSDAYEKNLRGFIESESFAG